MHLSTLLAQCLSLAVVAAQSSCTTSALSPKPTHFHCAAQGSLSKPQKITTTNTDSQELCRDAAYAQTGCKTFSYDPNSGECNLYRKSVRGQNFSPSESGLYFWNLKCFTTNCPVCPSDRSLTSCDPSNPDTCTNLNTDEDNCGVCGNNTQCGANGPCYQGNCGCPRSLDNCGGQCIDTSSSSNNCGGCNISCPNGASCQGSECFCSDSNTPVSQDPQNCGSCGNACGNNQVCDNGSCVCAPNTQTCNGSCVNTNTDSQNCGACSNSCDSGSCSGGVCQCPGGQTLCGSHSCFDTTSNDNHCGNCGTPCINGQTCHNSQCVDCADPSQTKCNGLCTNTNNDQHNCGSCGHDCGTSGICSNGQCACSASTCPATGCDSTPNYNGPDPGYPDPQCNGSGCYNFNTDVNNCGSCGYFCGKGPYTCDSGTCVCQYGAAGICGNWPYECVQTGTNQNCAGCGNACPSTQSCVTRNGASQCIDLNTDDNCGTAGNQCGPGHTCLNQQCVAGCTHVYSCASGSSGNSCGSDNNVCRCLAPANSSEAPQCAIVTQGSYSCGQTPCSSSSQCPSGYFCADACCTNRICLPISTASCANSASAKFLFGRTPEF